LVHVHAQVQTGYISIDCGSPENFNYVDQDTGISYTSDESFINTGTNRNISSEYAYPNNPMLPQPLSDLRTFPQGNKNCYTLRPNGGKSSLNLIRATFMYGNYDGQDKLPEFDLYLGVNLWLSVKFINASDVVMTEIVHTALDDTISVCLINTGKDLILEDMLMVNGRNTDDMFDRFVSPYISPSWDSLPHGYEIDVTRDWNSLPRSLERWRSQFPAAELLMRVHHRNLVSFVGYSHNDNKMALVYEYMANGNLKSYISDRSVHPLSWEMRLKIATDAAQGLEYLHHGCRPAIIHRDVKSANILLNENLDAKIADFGLSKGLPDDYTTHILTNVTGTTGYLDPEYRRSHNLNEKSDVYSFGIVLLELITGQPAIIKNKDHIHIMHYVGPYLEQGDITSIIDEQMGDDYNLDSVWKAVEISVACTRAMSTQRMTMSEVLTGLKMCLEMELARGPRNKTNYVGGQKMGVLRIDHSPEVCSMDFDLMTGISGR
ncbi:probable LRR receptor-like serine/threonine-protein kinase, partial [Tanacetum coccineum]